MIAIHKEDLITMIDQSSKELHRNIDYHRFRMTSILDEGFTALGQIAIEF